MTSLAQHTYTERASQAREHLASRVHTRALKTHAEFRARSRASHPPRDWGTSNCQPPQRWREVDECAIRLRVAVTYHAEFDAVSLSAGQGAVGYADTPRRALLQITALVHARDGGR